MRKNATTKKPAKPKKTQQTASPQAGPDAGPPQNVTENENGFPLVGVGASAGGFEAFSEILHDLPADPGMAFVFVQHLDPKHVSMLAQLLGTGSKIPVLEAENGAKVEPNHVYVIPRNTSISIEKGMLRLGPREMVGGQFTSIDTFLRSLAEDQGSRAIGVVLSGNASDGTLGLKAIKAAGGVTFAQDPSTAKFDSMPRSAIAAGWVDFVRKPADLAQELLRLGRHPYLTAAKPDSKEDAFAKSPAESSQPSSDALTRILAIVRSGTGVDFSLYKPNTVQRRISRRMVLRRTDTLDQYLALIRSDSAEVHALYEDLLISVTEFFRDPQMYENLANTVFPKILNQRSENLEIRLWIAGCSTGEEVYSIAITLLEALGDKSSETRIQIFATDISESSLEKARAGIYPISIAQHILPERLRRFFTNVESGYQISKRVREMCVFARHNLAKDPPFSRLDLISCRNVPIYLGPQLQERIIPMFHYALKPNGYLLLGPSETIGAYPDMFQLIDQRYKIYQRRPAASHIPFEMAIERPPAEKPSAVPKPEIVTEFDLQREADRILLKRYAPPGVVVDDELNILQFRGKTSPLLEPASGSASLNLLRMLREGLSHEVRAALARARKENGPARRERVHFRMDGSEFVNIEVIPLRRVAVNSGKYLVLFEPVAPPPHAAVKGAKPGKGAGPQLQAEIQQLRMDLAASQDYLQSVIEDHEAAQEELRSAAEEIQSSNEELQSTNEELETAKEELQSTNEELNTLNEELQHRNMQLTQLGNDLLNLLANVNMPIIFIGNDLRIRRFTAMAERTLNLIPSDVGRPIRDINLRIPVPNLDAVLTEVTESLVPKVLEVKDPDGKIYSLRIRPYRTEDNKIDGLVLVFIDIDPVMGSTEPGPVSALPSYLGNSNLRTSLLMMQEEERRRLAHELHDELNQRLALLEFNVQTLAIRKDPEQVFKQLEGFRASIAGLSDDLRRLAYQLHPAILDDLGLVAAVEAYCREFSEREGIEVRFSNNAMAAHVPRQVALTAYRLVQEALRNVAKHSGAKQAAVFALLPLRPHLVGSSRFGYRIRPECGRSPRHGHARDAGTRSVHRGHHRVEEPTR